MLHRNLLLTMLMMMAIPWIALSQGWDRTYTDFEPRLNAEAIRVLPLPDGGALALVSDTWNAGVSDFLNFGLMKLDAAGAVTQYVPFSFSGDEYADDLVRTPDGGYAILYARTVGGNTANFILRLDAQFGVLWNKQIANVAADEYVTCLTTYDGGFLAGGVGPNSEGLLLQTDADGNVLGWLDSPNEDIYALVRTERLSSGSVISLGFADVDYNNTALSRWSAGAQWQADTILDSNGALQAQDFAITSGDQIFVSIVNGQSEAGVALLDSNFNLLWERTLPGPDRIVRVSVLPDGSGFWVVGVYQGSGLTEGYMEIMQLDAQGNLVSARPIPRLSARHIQGLDDGGCLIGGARLFAPAIHESYPRILRLDEEGQDYTAGISGTVWLDLNADCTANADSVQYNWDVQAVDASGFLWWATTDSAGHYTLPLAPGDYTVTLRRPNAVWTVCQDTLLLTVAAGDTLTGVDFVTVFDPQPVDSICGILFRDYDGDCQKDVFEPVFPNWPVEIFIESPVHLQNTTLTAVTDAEGRFCISDLSGIDNSYTGLVRYWVLDQPGDGLTCWVTCEEQMRFNFLPGNGVFIPIGMQCDTLPPCPVMEVSVVTGAIRPCSNPSYSVRYCNKGAALAENASIVITVDSALVVTGASVPWDDVNGNAYTFNLGDVPSEQCGYLFIYTQVPCDDPVGTTYCVEAHAYPDTLCGEPGFQWDGSEIEVTADCQGDSVVFTIRNIGTGDMSQAHDYIVIEDNVLLMQSPGSFQLDAGQELQISFPADGAFFRLEAEQSAGFPGLNLPVAWVEGCGAGGNFSLGYVNQYALPDEEPWLDIFCLESVNSFDPNDKNGFPRGYDDERYINQNTDIEYVIRFQNTGTAPAINVEIRDTLPVQQLDVTSVRPGASSHPYQFDIQGDGVVVFRFPNIYLPDTSQGQDVSQGFVKFRVSQLPDLAPGTKIRNSAAIYFDNNAPIITNQTLHTIGKDFILVETLTPLLPDVLITAAPNPTTGIVRLTLDGLPEATELRLVIWSLTGQPVMEAAFTGKQYEMDAGLLPDGVYLFTIQQGSQAVGSGKIVKNGG